MFASNHFNVNNCVVAMTFRLTIATDAVVCKEALLEGEITIGSGNLVTFRYRRDHYRIRLFSHFPSYLRILSTVQS